MKSDIAALLWKEFRQLPRKRGAVLTATIFPILFLVVVPGINLGATMAMPASSNGIPAGVNLPPGFAAAASDGKTLVSMFTFPLFVMLAGLMLPSIMAAYTIIAERERRTLELLVALPVSVTSIVVAKLLCVVAVSAGITVPLLALDSIVLVAMGLAGAGDILLFFWLLLTALTYSTAAFIIVGLLAGDYRTANNITGALVGPLVLVSMGMLAMLPPGIGAIALGGLLLVGAALATYVAARRLTLERLMG
jgi:ABC-type Na+ efflux pump permease subunit